jgi:hypothetical protein
MPITAQGEFTLKDLRRGILFAAKRVWLSVFVFEIVAFAAIYFWGWDGRTNWVLLVTIAVWVVVLAAVMAALVYIRSYRMKRKSPAMQGIIRYEFDDVGMKVVGPHSTSEMRWSAIIKWRENKSTILLYATPHFANFLPKRFFSTPADLAAVEAFLREHVSARKK